MTERKYAVVSLDELDTFPAMAGAPVLIPLHQRLDVRAFGVNSWTAPVGAPVIERHSEPDGDEEVYVVVRGRVRFTIGEDTRSKPRCGPGRKLKKRAAGSGYS